MAALRYRIAALIPVVALAACASATDRMNEGITLQSQGRYMEAVYRYADAVEKDGQLAEARDRLLAVGDTAIQVGMDEANDFERRGDPVSSARIYEDIDQMLGRVRQVGIRLDPPEDYAAIRRLVFDNAIGWQMVRGDEAREQGRWEDARDYFVGARTAFLQPSRIQLEESYDSETRVLLDWARIELSDGRPQAAHALAQQAVEVRGSPARDVVLEVRNLQNDALEAGTVVVAILPVTADPGVRQYLGADFEIELDDMLQLDYWNQPPLFVDVADPVILSREMRGLLRGQVGQSPIIVGRALELIGADLGVMIQLAAIEVTEADVDRDRYTAVVPKSGTVGRGVDRQAGTDMDTLTYTTLEGDLSYYVEADVVIVDREGREVERFTSSARETGPFQRGEFVGNPAVLELEDARKRFFDPTVLAEQVGRIEAALLADLAAAIATGTYDTVLSGVP